MINYYKILGVDDFADLQQIKAAYRNKAKLYHPDIATSAEAEDIFKLINQANGILSNPASKVVYDQKLKAAQLYSRINPAIKKRKFPAKEDILNWAKKELEEEKKEYQESNNFFAYKWRIILSAAAGLLGLGIAFINWFTNELDHDFFYIILGFTLFVFSLLLFTQVVYKKLRMDYLHGNKKFKNYENVAVYGFIISLIAGPAMVVGLSAIKKEVYLRWSSNQTIARIISYDFSKVTYGFTDNHGHKIVKIQQVPSNAGISVSQEWIHIKYSTYDPRITEIETGRP